MAAGSAFADDPVVGYWKSFGEKGEVNAYWKTWIENGEVRGTIVKIPGHGDDSICVACKDDTSDWSGKPVIGTIWMWGLKRDGSEWKGGHIIDSGKGKIFWLSVKVINNGNSMEMRGSIDRWGLIGGTQVWTRLSQKELSDIGVKK